MGTMGRVENVLRTRRMEVSLLHSLSYHSTPLYPLSLLTLSNLPLPCHVSQRLAKGADIQNAMKGYREAFHPPPPSPPQPNRTSSPNMDVAFNSDPERDIRTPTPTPANGVASSRGDEPLFDEADLDEMAAMEEMEREARTSRPNGSGDDGPPPQLDEEDDWEGLYD